MSNNKAFVTEICDLMEQFDKAKAAWIKEFGTEEGFQEWVIKRIGFDKPKFEDVSGYGHYVEVTQ